MAWIIFGTFFLIDAHAPWYWYLLWTAANVYDLAKEYKESHKKVVAPVSSGARLL